MNITNTPWKFPALLTYTPWGAPVRQGTHTEIREGLRQLLAPTLDRVVEGAASDHEGKIAGASAAPPPTRRTR